MEFPSTIEVVPATPGGGGKAACLVNIYPAGPDMGRRYTFGSTPLILGRDADCNVLLADPAVSRRHARLQPAVDGYYVIDHRSLNGTFVNDERVARAKLCDGDYLRVGSTIFRFLDRDNVEAAYHEEIYRLAIQDALTGLANRRHLIEFLSQELARCERFHRPLGLVLIDVDHFKEVNDEYGHLGGDAALRQLADCLRPRIRQGDLLARYGGEEFVLALTEAGPVDAARVAEDLRRLIERTPFEYGGRSFHLTVSMGVAATPGGEPADAARLILQADERLYQAKQAGRNAAVA